MSRVIVVTDSNSGITQSEAKELGVVVMPMPFYINGQMFYEDIDLTQEQFYQKLKEGGEIKTSMPLVGDVTDKWDELLKEYDEIVYIPMSSGLSSSCETAYMLSQDYDGKVQVVNNQRISVTMRQSVLDAKMLAEQGLRNPDDRKAIARHEVLCTLDDILQESMRLLQDKGRFYMIHRPFRLTEILIKMSQYKIEPKRIQFVHPYIDKEPTMVLVEGMRGAKPRVKIEPPLIMYSRDGGLRMENGYGHTGG